MHCTRVKPFGLIASIDSGDIISNDGLASHRVQAHDGCKRLNGATTPQLRRPDFHRTFYNPRWSIKEDDCLALTCPMASQIEAQLSGDGSCLFSPLTPFLLCFAFYLKARTQTSSLSYPPSRSNAAMKNRENNPVRASETDHENSFSRVQLSANTVRVSWYSPLPE